jgi:hypothetical protein
MGSFKLQEVSGKLKQEAARPEKPESPTHLPLLILLLLAACS